MAPSYVGALTCGLPFTVTYVLARVHTMKPTKLLLFILLLTASCLLPTISFAQPLQQWVRSYNGTANNIDYGRALRIDAAGNAYVVGTATNSGAAKDITVIKYNTQGVQEWVATYNGTANADDWGYGLVIDSSGNSFATGFTSTSATGKDFVTVKFNSSGEFQWAMQYNGTQNLDDAANHIAIDPWGNVVVTGISKGSGTGDDFATVKYSPAGTQLWVAQYNGPANDVDDARTITTDKWGNIYVSGGSTGIGSGYDYATVKYDSTGTQKWIARYNGPNNDYDLVYYQGSVVADTLGNVYITGYSTGLDSSLDYATIKYDSLGNQLWISRFSTDSAGTDYADAIHVDDSLNVYVTGGSYKASNNYDFATVKYNPQGVQQWVAYYNGTVSDWDEAYGVITDDSLNVYIVGRSPGTGTMADFVIVKYSPSGSQIWEARYANSGYDWPFSIGLLNNDCIYVGGNLAAPSFSDIGVTKYCQSTVGIETSVETTSEFDVYPNPSNGKITINSYQHRAPNSQLTTFTVLRDKVFRVTIDNQLTTINLDLPDGIYFLQLKTKSGIQTKKIVINN